MLSLLGSGGVVAALIGAVLLIGRGVKVARGGESDLTSPARLLLSGAVVAMLALEIALLTDDLSLVYTADHHSSVTPFPFDVATAWAALEGSIVLWGLVLAGFTWGVLTRYRKNPDPLGAAALAVMGVVAVFFFGLMITVANPFEYASRPWRWGVPNRAHGPSLRPTCLPRDLDPTRFFRTISSWQSTRRSSTSDTSA